MTGGFIAPVRILEKPVNTPWVCAWCHCGDNGVREFFIDTGLSFDFEGTVYLCNECGKELRKGAGWLTREEFDAETQNLKTQIQQLQAEVADYEIIKAFLKDYGLDPVGLKRLKLAPATAKEELRGRLNPNSVVGGIAEVSASPDPIVIGSEPQSNTTVTDDGADVAANAFRSIFGID
jgi:hypothetical protein